jgi:hypothetical protein
MTMNTMKTLMLAGFTALSVGMGTAMAQEGGSTYPATPAYQMPNAAKAPGAGLVQSGSSDADVAPRAPMNWRDLPTYGGQG